MLIKIVNSDCRCFLWHITYDSDSLNFINWDDVCKPRWASNSVYSYLERYGYWQNCLVSWQLEKSLFGFDGSMGSIRKMDNGYCLGPLTSVHHEYFFGV